MEGRSGGGIIGGMTNADMLAAIRLRPFVPFIIHTADGGNVPVASPEMIFLEPGRRVFALQFGDNQYEMIDLLLVVKISFQSRPNLPKIIDE